MSIPETLVLPLCASPMSRRFLVLVASLMLLLAESLARHKSDSRFQVAFYCPRVPQVYWNVPSHVCYTRNETRDVERFGILSNSEQSFYGERVWLPL